MRLSMLARRVGVWAALIALVALLGAPVSVPARMLAAAAIGDAPVCGEHPPSAGTADHAAGDRVPVHGHAMADCVMCGCCAPLMALMPARPAPPAPVRLVLASAARLPPARAPPEAARATCFARGPPASI
jgi:hypothetical protein